MIDDMLSNRKTFEHCDEFIQALQNDGSIEVAPKRDVMIASLMNLFIATIMGTYALVEKDMSLDQYAKEVQTILRNRGPQVKDAVISYLGE